MDFSELFPFNGPHPLFSPDGKYLAVVVEYRLLIRDCQTLKVVQMFSCLDKVKLVQWSFDSKYIMCVLLNRSIIQVWYLDDIGWTCKIDEGQAGITNAQWCPDGKSILIRANFEIKATIWSLEDKKCSYISGPKFPDRGLYFNQNGSLLAISEVL